MRRAWHAVNPSAPRWAIGRSIHAAIKGRRRTRHRRHWHRRPPSTSANDYPNHTSPLSSLPGTILCGAGRPDHPGDPGGSAIRRAGVADGPPIRNAMRGQSEARPHNVQTTGRRQEALCIWPVLCSQSRSTRVNDPEERAPGTDSYSYVPEPRANRKTGTSAGLLLSLRLRRESLEYVPRSPHYCSIVFLSGAEKCRPTRTPVAPSPSASISRHFPENDSINYFIGAQRPMKLAELACSIFILFL